MRHIYLHENEFDEKCQCGHIDSHHEYTDKRGFEECWNCECPKFILAPRRKKRKGTDYDM